MSFQSFVEWTCDHCFSYLKTSSFHLPPGWERFYERRSEAITKHKCEKCVRREKRAAERG